MTGRNVWGWGLEERALDGEARERLAMLLATQLDVSPLVPLEPRTPRLPASRISLPDRFAVAGGDHERAGHTYGKAFRDVIRGLAGDFGAAPDVVATPRDADELRALLDHASEQGFAVVPYGGGSSVVGGVEGRCRDAVAGLVSLDLRHLSGLHEYDDVSQLARIGAGTEGPALETALGAHGMTLRHYPQSFEHSTLGGWIATRAGGHFATLHTHIDDFVAGMSVAIPGEILTTRRLPGSGAGPSPDRAFIGSEGALGVITEAWMRVRPRPLHKAAKTVRFADLYAAAEAARHVVQARLYPSNCRVLDGYEALINGVGDGSEAFLLLAFESHHAPQDELLAQAVSIAQDHGGTPKDGRTPTALAFDDDGGDASDRWKKMFLRGPYLRDALLRLGAITETFETAITWDRFEAFHRALLEAARGALARVGAQGIVSSRITHVYPDGAAPYFTVVAVGKAGAQLQQWDDIKAAVSDAIISAGGTITHHHAVGRDHGPHYRQQVPAAFLRALAAEKRVLDPAGILNPGVLLES